MILDHIIPLALGGHPRQPSNLQLQDKAESQRKDRIEVKLQCLVCSGQVQLEEARSAIAMDWEAAYHQFANVKCRWRQPSIAANLDLDSRNVAGGRPHARGVAGHAASLSDRLDGGSIRETAKDPREAPNAD